MMWWLVVFVSSALILIGAGLLVRDLLSPPARVPKSIVRGNSAVRSAKASLAKVIATAVPSAAAAADARASIPATAKRSRSERGEPQTAAEPGMPRLQLLEHHWSRLKAEIETAIAGVNQSMAPLGLVIGAPGEANWSLHNQGFGDYRRVLVNSVSLAWLRLEIGADMSITARVRAHDAEHVGINRDALAPAQRTDGQLAQTVTDSLKGAFDYAVWRHSNNVRNDAPMATASPQSPTASMQRAMPVQTAPIPATMPSPSAALIDAAVALVNKAFAEVGAELRPTDQRRGATTAFADRAVSITMRGVAVGLMLIEPRADRIDISVGVADMANFQAARRQSQPMPGLTVHALAEVIATNAWPAIAAASSQAVA